MAQSSPNTIGRRAVVAGLATLPFAIAGCGATHSGSTGGSFDEFTVVDGDSRVRCQYYDRLIQGDRPSCLAIVLVHGAGADSTQWFDIGLVDAIDAADLDGHVHRVVAVAPNFSDFAVSASQVDALITALDSRFAPGHLAVSGISRGAAVALDIAATVPHRIESVGLHSPAIRVDQPIDHPSWSCWIDVGDDDSLAADTHRLADSLTAGGADVSTHFWPGGHNRPYWREHMPAYVRFHIDVARQRSV